MIVEMSGASTKISNPEVNLFFVTTSLNLLSQRSSWYSSGQKWVKNICLWLQLLELWREQGPRRRLQVSFLFCFFKSWHQLGYEILFCFLFSKIMTSTRLPDARQGSLQWQQVLRPREGEIGNPIVKLSNLSNCKIIKLSNCQLSNCPIIKLSNTRAIPMSQWQERVDCSSNIC